MGLALNTLLKDLKDFKEVKVMTAPLKSQVPQVFSASCHYSAKSNPTSLYLRDKFAIPSRSLRDNFAISRIYTEPIVNLYRT
jgi:hypothetical protein